MAVTRLSGGLTPGDGADPRTFPAIWNVTAGEIETAQADIVTLQGTVASQGSAISVIEAWDIDDLNDVSLGTAVTDGQVLSYSTAIPGWTNVDSAGGNLVVTKSVLKTDTQVSASVGGGSAVAVTGLSITHALANASNKLLISAYFGVAASDSGFGSLGLAVADDGTLINVGAAAGSRTQTSAGGIVSFDNETYVVTMPSIQFVYEPGDIASHTYTVRAINLSGASRTLYINRNERDNDSAGEPRGSSGFVIQEVAA